MTLKQAASAARKDVGHVLQHAVAKHGDFAARCPARCDKTVISESGLYISDRGYKWIYVITGTQGLVTIYPLLWWVTRKGSCALQVDAEGPAAFFQEHVTDRYIVRYVKRGDLFHAMRTFHEFNYAKASQPCDYQHHEETYAAVIDNGYVAGQLLPDEAIVFYHTFYDLKAGQRRFGHLRPAAEWQLAMHGASFEHLGRRDTPHYAWGRGYPVKPEWWTRAA